MIGWCQLLSCSIFSKYELGPWFYWEILVSAGWIWGRTVPTHDFFFKNGKNFSSSNLLNVLWTVPENSYLSWVDTLEDSFKPVVCKTLLARFRGGSIHFTHKRSFMNSLGMLHVWLFLKQTDSNSSPLPLFIYRRRWIKKLDSSAGGFLFI